MSEQNGVGDYEGRKKVNTIATRGIKNVLEVPPLVDRGLEGGRRRNEKAHSENDLQSGVQALVKDRQRRESHVPTFAVWRLSEKTKRQH